MNPILIKSFRTAAAAAPFTIAKITGANAAALATAAAAPLIGTFDAQGAEAGGMADVIMVGWAEVRLGGTVAVGDMLTSDDEGRAVKVTAGQTVRTIGMAMAAGVEDDVIPYFANPGTAAIPAA